jgi:hypothetical protein
MALAWVQQSATSRKYCHAYADADGETLRDAGIKELTQLTNYSPRRGAAHPRGTRGRLIHIWELAIYCNFFFVPSPSPRHRAGATKGPLCTIQIRHPHFAAML